MKTNAKLRGYGNVIKVIEMPKARRSGKGILSKPCNSFEMPSNKKDARAATNRPRLRQKHGISFDASIITRLLFDALLIVMMSGLLPMAAAILEIYLFTTYGLLAFALCIAVDIAAIIWLIRHAS